MWETPSKQSRGIDPPVLNRRGEGAQMKWCGNLGVPVALLLYYALHDDCGACDALSADSFDPAAGKK